MSQSKSKQINTKPKRVRWYFKLHLRSEPHEHVFFGEPTTHSTAPYLESINSKSKDIELDPFQDVDEESGWWFLLSTSNENLNYRLRSTSEQNFRRANKPRNFPVKGQLSLSLYYEVEARSSNSQLEENKIKKSESNSNSGDAVDDEKEDEANKEESESELINNAEEIDQIDEKDTPESSAEEIKDTKDMFTAYQLPLEEYSIALDPDLAETASPPKSKKRPTRTCQVEFTRQKKGLCGVFHVDFQRSEGRTDACVALFDNDTIVAVRLFVPMAYLPEEFKKEHEEELIKKQTRKIKFLEEDKLVEVHFINNKQPPAYHMSQDGIVDDKVQVVIEPERMTVPELKEALKERNLPLEGVKKDLVKRLAASLNIGTCFKTEDETKPEVNGKKGNKKKKASKASKKKSKAVEKLEAISEEQEEIQPESAASMNEVEKAVEETAEHEDKEEGKVVAKAKPKSKKKKAAKKKKAKTKKPATKKENEGETGNGSQEDIMGSPIFPSAFDSEDKMKIDAQPQSSPASETNVPKTESAFEEKLEIRGMKSAAKKGKAAKSPKKVTQAEAANNSVESSPESESTVSGASGSQGSSQGSNGETAIAIPAEDKISTPKRTPKKGRGRSPSKSKVQSADGSVETMAIEETAEGVVNNDGDNNSAASDKNSSQEIASSPTPKKQGQKRKREEEEAVNNNNADHDSPKQTEEKESENSEPQTKRRRLSRSKEDLAPTTVLDPKLVDV